MIHILGAGSIGSLFALSLARRSPVELLLKPSSCRNFVDVGKNVVQLNVPKMGGVQYESHIPARSIVPPRHDTANWKIEQLLVAVKTHDILPALASVKSHITADTEVVVLHNGMGVWEQITQQWEGELPKFGFGVTDAGVRRHVPMWKFDYTGNGLCTVSRPHNKPMKLLENLVDSKELVVTDEVDWQEFVVRQKRKLVVNAAINPLTALLQCYNGALSDLGSRNRLVFRLVQESCRILGLNKDEMNDLVEDVIERTSTNISSMLTDVENGRTSEIEYINGYIAREAIKQGTTAPLNTMLRDLVNMRIGQVRKEMNEAVPLQSS